MEAFFFITYIVMSMTGVAYAFMTDTSMAYKGAGEKLFIAIFFGLFVTLGFYVAYAGGLYYYITGYAGTPG